jgi:hypothetical protein
MLKLIIYGIAAFALWSTGTWGYALLAYIGWEFFKGMQGGAGAVGGLQAVVLKGLCAGMLYFALMSPSIRGSYALLLGLAGAIGLMTQKFPTFRLGKKMQEGIAATKADDAAVAKRDGQRETDRAVRESLANGGDGRSAMENGAERDVKKDEGITSAEQGLSDKRDSNAKERQDQGRQPGGKQGFLNWFVHGSDGSGSRSNGSKQGLVSWFLFGSKGAPANAKQGVGSWLVNGSTQSSGGGWVSWFLFGKPMKKKSKSKN